MSIGISQIDQPGNRTISSATMICILLILFLWGFLIPSLGAVEPDFGLGFGMYHGMVHGQGELPDNVDKMTVFSPFMSLSAELGFAVSDDLKLSVKPYYHSRNYTYESHWDNDFQLYGHYLDVPISLGVNVRGTEWFAGAGVGVLLDPYVFHDNDFTEPEGGWDDLERIVPSLHLGTRLPLTKGKSIALEVKYAHDLIPFSHLWGRKNSQDRYVALLTARFNQAPSTKDLLPDSLKISFNKLTLGMGFGFQSQALKLDGVHNYSYETEYRRARFIPAFEISAPISDKFSLGLNPTYNVRSYTVRDYEDYNDFMFRAGYWDLPLLLSAHVDGVEYGIGPNLGIRASQTYKNRDNTSIPDALKDAAGWLPGYAVNIRLGFKKYSPWAVQFQYSQDLAPFSNTYSTHRYQSRSAFYLSYRFARSGKLKDLLPEGFRDKYYLQRTTTLGVASSTVLDIKLLMPTISNRKMHRFPSGIGWGNSLTWGYTFGSDREANASIMFVRAAYQFDLSWRKRFLEVFVAPGVGMDAGVLTDSTPGAWFPVLPYMNVMFVRDAGMRVHFSPKLSLSASIGAVNSGLFNEIPILKLGIGIRR